MSKYNELDNLKAEERVAFQRKQETFQNYISARKEADAAYDAMQRAWEQRTQARERMNHEYEKRKSAFENHDYIWEDYARIRDSNNSQIESLKYDADAEHRAMQDCFDRASDAYTYGDRSEAPMWSQEGYEHKERRDELNAEISMLAHEVKSARAYAESHAPRVDSSEFEYAKAEFETAKSIHESAQAEFKRLKEQRDQLKNMFDNLHAEHIRCKETFQKRLNEIKTRNQRERNKILDKAGVSGFDREDAKIVKKDDGTIQVYHGGLGKGDGIGHGHTAIDNTGKVNYDRKAFAEHGKQNFTEEKDGWSELYGGTIGDQPVLVKFGTGRNEGHTLIADNIGQSRRNFNRPDKDGKKRHNHYGTTRENGGADYFSEDRGAYTGPGH